MYLGKWVFWWQIHICIWANWIFGGKYQLGIGQIRFRTGKNIYVFGQIGFLVADPS
jgi:hypothetical protein